VFRAYRVTWSFGAAAAAFGGSSLALYFAAMREDERVEEDCSDTCAPGADDYDKRDRLIAWSNAALALSAALAVTTVIVLFRERRRAQRPTSGKPSAARLRDPLLVQF
jgi:hypothetical protein